MDIVSLAYCSSSRKSFSTKISYTHALEYWPPGPNSAISDSSIPSQIQKKGLTGISDANVLFLIHSPNTNILFWIHYHVFLINVISKWTHDFLEISNIFPMYFLVSSAVILCNDLNYFLPVGLNILKYLKEKKKWWGCINIQTWKYPLQQENLLFGQWNAVSISLAFITYNASLII